MSNIVEMYRDAVEPGGRDRFACTVSTWELLQEIGQTFGWRPMGATYVAPVQPKLDSRARRDYRAGGALDQKQIERDDAIAWATALQVAKDSPHLAAMIAARGAAIASPGAQVAETLLPGVIEDFVEFAFGGAFTFVLSSAAEP